MTDSLTEQPAAWRIDPTGRHEYRYWDGLQWTDHVADRGVAAMDAFATVVDSMVDGLVDDIANDLVESGPIGDVDDLVDDEPFDVPDQPVEEPEDDLDEPASDLDTTLAAYDFFDASRAVFPAAGDVDEPEPAPWLDEQAYVDASPVAGEELATDEERLEDEERLDDEDELLVGHDELVIDDPEPIEADARPRVRLPSVDLPRQTLLAGALAAVVLVAAAGWLLGRGGGDGGPETLQERLVVAMEAEGVSNEEALCATAIYVDDLADLRLERALDVSASLFDRLTLVQAGVAEEDATQAATRASEECSIDPGALGGAKVAVPAGTYGSDEELDALWDACAADELDQCDLLLDQSPLGSEYEEFAETCGNRNPPEGYCAPLYAGKGPSATLPPAEDDEKADTGST